MGWIENTEISSATSIGSMSVISTPRIRNLVEALCLFAAFAPVPALLKDVILIVVIRSILPVSDRGSTPRYHATVHLS